MVEEGQTIAVWFSCGAASAVAAKLAIQQYGNIANVRVLNTPVLEEGADNQRFRKDVGNWLGVKIETVTNPKWPENSAQAVWDKTRFLSGPFGARCTLELKKNARYAWEKDNHADWHILGFTADENDRFQRFKLTERSNVIPILAMYGLKKRGCFEILEKEGIRLPEAYALGYPNANCRGCVKATSPDYWNLVRRVDPDVFAARVQTSRDLGVRLVEIHKERVFLDELPTQAEQQSLIPSPDCGFWCEEPAGEPS
ncbi:hypothetical protein AD935_11005 [Gluconobacter japonicus]|nr:hypothetical protein AD935_11005 [Gluconobacter japonicus]